MKKRLFTFALAAALLLALGISAYAVWSMPRSTGTYLMPQDAEYTDLSALPTIEKDVGYPVTVPERFSNGYAFTRLRVGGEALFGENNEVLETYYSVRALYTRPDRAELWLTLTPVLAVEKGSELPAPIPNEQQSVDGVSVKLFRDHYKIVPDGYEKTQDDLDREAAGHYYITYGSDEIVEYDIASADFTLDTVIYTLMDMDAKEDSFVTFLEMAAEIIAEAHA